MTKIWNAGLLFPIFAILIISLTTLLPLDKNLFLNQLVFTVLGFFTFAIFSVVDYKILKGFSLPILIISLSLLFLVLALGTEVRGAVRWFDLGGFRFQVSEVLKPFLIISLAGFLSNKKLTFGSFLITLFFITIVSLPIFLQPDLGNTLIYILTGGIMLLFYGMPFFYFLIPGTLIFIALPIIWHLLRNYQKQRLTSFLNPESDPLGASYNLIQAVIAVGGGELLGRGLGHGTQSQLKFLPERHTDFIFASLAENFGFLGAILLLTLFIFLLFKIYKIIKETDDSFGALFGAGVFGLILVQLFLNIGGNIGILPITGVTLPFVSYGGSSLISTFIMLGILNSISANIKKSPRILEIR